MWWTIDNRVHRQPKRLEKAIAPQRHPQAKSTWANQKPRCLKSWYQKLPITTDQAAANLKLQESGADCNAEVPRLRKDIRSLESALRSVVRQREDAVSAIDLLQFAKRHQLKKMDQLLAELAALKGENEHAQQRAREVREWLTNAADLVNALVRRAGQQKNDAKQHGSELILALEQLRSDNQSLTDQLESVCQENRIYADVICDMESRQATELRQAREQHRLLKNRLTQNGAADRSQVQQLNIRIVSQAAEIRSLGKQLADIKSSQTVHESGYETILDSQAMSGNQSYKELNQRLENSLHAARMELDAAVHELNYANAEANRLREYAKQVEQKYDSEFYHVVQVAELHANLAAMLQQSREAAVAVNPSQAGSPLDRQTAREKPTLDELVARNNELVEALEAIKTPANNTALSSETIESQAHELTDLSREVGRLRESQAALAGENETLSASKQDLEQRLAGLAKQLVETEEARSADKTEWEKLLAHHQGGTQVANAECRLIKGQLEEQRDAYEFKLKQQLEVIKCLHSDVGAARGLQAQLEEKLEVEIVNRQLAEQETKLVKREAARVIDSLPVQGQGKPNDVADKRDDERDAESSIPAAA